MTTSISHSPRGWSKINCSCTTKQFWTIINFSTMYAKRCEKIAWPCPPPLVVNRYPTRPDGGKLGWSHSTSSDGETKPRFVTDEDKWPDDQTKKGFIVKVLNLSYFWTLNFEHPSVHLFCLTGWNSRAKDPPSGEYHHFSLLRSWYQYGFFFFVINEIFWVYHACI